MTFLVCHFSFHFPLGNIHARWFKSPCKCAWITVKITQDCLKQIKNGTSDQKLGSFLSVVSSSIERSKSEVIFYWQELSLGIMKTTVEAQSGTDCPSGAQSNSLSLLVRRHDSLGINWHNFSLLGCTSTHLPITADCFEAVLTSAWPRQDCCCRICIDWSDGKKFQ